VTAAVLDASAVAALLRDEPGADSVLPAIHQGSALLTLNASEAMTVLIRDGATAEEAAGIVLALPVSHVPMTTEIAAGAAALWPKVRGSNGIGIGDRACLALARLRGLPVLTADRAWAGLDLGAEIRVIR
jgi:ribonuclease VapC